MKWILILYICSMNTNNCPTNSISGYQFDTHYDCVKQGYILAHNSFLKLDELEDYEKDYIEQEKIVVKFECKGLQVNNT